MSGTHDRIREAAAAHGFSLVGVAPAAPAVEALAALEAWCAAGHAGALGYMTRNPPERADPRTLLAGVRSVVTVAVNHFAPAAPFRAEGRYGRVARYAWGRDYHDVVLPRLRALAGDLAAAFGGRGRTACDYAPLLERAFADRAGIGFFGKNTCLLLPRRGSWFLLGEVLLEAELPPTTRDGTDHCGTCRDCLPACPTQAFPAPYVLDARRCLSYLTIEYRGALPRALRAAQGAWVFGCDDCQEVCPFNRFADPTDWSELRPEAGAGPRLDLAEVLAIRSDEAFRARFAGTPLLRPRRRGLLRNAAVAARNVGATGAVDPLRACLDDPEPLVRQHALWALAGLAPGEARRAAGRLRGDGDPGVAAEAEATLSGAEPCI